MSLSFLPPPGWEFSIPQATHLGQDFRVCACFPSPQSQPWVEENSWHRIGSPWINGEDSLLAKSLHAAKPVTLLIKEAFSEMLCSVIRSVDSWWHGEWLASYFMHSKQKNTQMWMSASLIHCFWNKVLRNLSSLGCSLESEKQCKGKTLLCFLSPLSTAAPALHCRHHERAFHTSSYSVTSLVSFN